MRTHQPSMRSGRLMSLVALLAACAGTPVPEASAPASQAHFAVDALAAALVRDAQQRVDTNSLRVYVDELREAREPGEDVVTMRLDHGELAAVGRELQRELVVALTSRLNLIDVDSARRTAGLAEDAPAETVARAVGATHMLVGTFSPRRDELDVLVRLVDARNLVIVAAASGVLAVDDLSDLGRLALAPVEPVPIELIDIPARPRVAVQPPIEEPRVRAAFRQPPPGSVSDPLADPLSEPAVRALSPQAEQAVQGSAPVPAAVDAAGAAASEAGSVRAPAPVVAGEAKPPKGAPQAGEIPGPVEEPVDVSGQGPVDGPALRRLKALGRNRDGTPAVEREPQ